MWEADNLKQVIRTDVKLIWILIATINLILEDMHSTQYFRKYERPFLLMFLGVNFMYI